MQNSFMTKISPSVRIVVLVLLTISLLLANSIYLISFITTLTLILFIVTDEKVKSCVNVLKKISLLLLFFIIIYIIIFGKYSFIYIIILSYKLLIIVILFKLLFLNMDFKDIHQGLYGVLKSFKKHKVNLEKISLDITLSIYFIKLFIESKEVIKGAQTTNGKRIINIKNLVLPSIVYSINQLEKLQDNLKIKFYKLNYKKVNLRSKIIFLLFVLLFIICIIKEVML